MMEDRYSWNVYEDGGWWHGEVCCKETGERVFITPSYSVDEDAIQAVLDWIDDNWEEKQHD